MKSSKSCGTKASERKLCNRKFEGGAKAQPGSMYKLWKMNFVGKQVDNRFGSEDTASMLSTAMDTARTRPPDNDNAMVR